MNSKDYAKHITQLNRELYDEMGIEKSFMAISGISDKNQVMQMVITRMKQGLWNEIMVGKACAAWIPAAPLDMQVLLARQVDDEYRHYRWLKKRLQQLDQDPFDWEPLQVYEEILELCLNATDWGIYEQMMLMNYTVETVMAYWGNEPFINVIEPIDATTAALYRKIQKDEIFHHKVGRIAVERYATDEETQAKATAARDKILPYMRRIVPDWRARVEQAVSSVS
jgi:1,2-phenylacetyl-CoA epoxidase catalytic subunit